MGQFVSTNRIDKSNDELVNTLIKAEYIHSVHVEKIFRSIDRGLYYTDDSKLNAYKDAAWISGNIHLSAPSVYATVLECLDLQKGLKFLNIGSGIGYFSTLAGLLLGVNGVNHGIEIHGSLIDIAYQKLEEFKQKSAAIDYFEFCEPVFIEGNACNLLSVGYYDRVYCGAGVPPSETSFMKALLKIGGVLVMPLEGFLVKIIRKSEYTYKTMDVLEVSFTDLVVPETCSALNIVEFPAVEPMSLQELCRSNIRTSIRDSLNKSHPGLQMRIKCKPFMTYDQKFFSCNDPLTQFVRIQCGNPENYRTIVESLVGIEEEISISDLGSESESEAVGEDNDGDDEDDDDIDDEEKKNKSLPKKTESDTKRKSSEAGCSEQNKSLPEKPGNTKRMKMNASSSLVGHPLNSQSTSSSSDFWENWSDSSVHDEDVDNDSWASSEENNHNGLEGDNFGRIYNTLFNNENTNDSDTDSEIARQLVLYRFLNERKDNELSKLMKGKIDCLPVPALLKMFLNYNKKD